MSRVSIVETPWENDIIIHAMPNGNKPVKMDVAVTIDGKTVFRGADGKLYCSQLRKGGFCYPVSEWAFVPGLMAGLLALGVVTKAQVAQYKEAAAERVLQRDAKHDLQTLDRIATAHGIRIAARERAKLVKAAGLKEPA